MQRHEGGYYIRLLRATAPAAPPPLHGVAQQISIESIVQRQTAKTQSTAAPGRSGGPVVVLVTYATTEGTPSQGPRCGAPRPCNLRAAAGHPDRKELVAERRGDRLARMRTMASITVRTP